MRVDILLPVNENERSIFEVKSSTKRNNTQVYDLAFQLFILERLGLKIRDTNSTLFINQYIRHGKVAVGDQQGSCSIKKILVVMSAASYIGMTFSSGGEAMSSYIKYFVDNSRKIKMSN